MSAGTIAAIAGVAVAILSLFHIVVDPAVIGQTLTDLVNAVGDISIIWGLFHNHAAMKAMQAKISSKQ